MAKVTALGWGAAGTNADDPDYAQQQEKQWPGKRSATSPKKPANSPAKKQAARQSPAPKTEPPSSKAPQAASSTAGSADTPTAVKPTTVATKTVKGEGGK